MTATTPEVSTPRPSYANVSADDLTPEGYILMGTAARYAYEHGLVVAEDEALPDMPEVPWLRDVVMADPGGAGNPDCPVHVTSTVLFNGHIAPIRIRGDEPIKVEAAGGYRHEETRLTMTVHPQDVRFKVLRGGMVVPFTLGGYRVLTPRDDLWEHIEDPAQVYANGSHYPLVAESSDDWIEVVIQVRSAGFLAQTVPAHQFVYDPETEHLRVEEGLRFREAKRVRTESAEGEQA